MKDSAIFSKCRSNADTLHELCRFYLKVARRSGKIMLEFHGACKIQWPRPENTDPTELVNSSTCLNDARQMTDNSTKLVTEFSDNVLSLMH